MTLFFCLRPGGRKRERIAAAFDDGGIPHMERIQEGGSAIVEFFLDRAAALKSAFSFRSAKSTMRAT